MLKFKKFSESVELDEAYKGKNPDNIKSVGTSGGSVLAVTNAGNKYTLSAKDTGGKMPKAGEPISKYVKESSGLDEASVKKGDSVKIINAKKYDALSKPEVSGIVIGMLGSKVMVKVGSGQMNVDAKDLVKESVEEASNLHTVYSDISEAFMRIPKSVRGNDLVALKQSFDAMYNSLSNGGDWKPEVYKSLVKQMAAVSKSAKSFNSKDDMSSMYEANSDISESDGERYGVFSKGGSIGQNSNKPPVKVFSNADEAKAYAKRMRAALSPGERRDYGMSYIVKKVNESVELGEANVKKGDTGTDMPSESTAEYGKSQTAIARKKQQAAMKPGEMDKLKRLRDMLKNANKKESVELDEVKVKNSDAAMDLEKEISDLEKRISKLTPLARKDDDANMQLVRAKSRLKQKQEKHKQLMKEEVELGENYRILAQQGMGTESKADARIGLELDYYDDSGSKRMGKITKLTSTGYVVKDDKDGKSRSFAFHDRAKAKELLAKHGKGKYNESVELGESPFDAYKRDFKSREMDYELRDEKPDSKGKKHIVTIKGKAWKTFASHDQALKAARTLTNKGVQASVRMESVDLEDVKLHEAGSPDRLAIIKKAAQKVKARQAAADKKAMQAAKRDMKSPGAQRGMAPLKKELDESRNEALKALEYLVKTGGVDKADFQKAHDLYKAAKINDLRKHISSLDTDPGEAIARAISRRDSKTFNNMYPRAKAGDYFANIIANHGSKLKEAKGSKYDAYHKDFSTAVQYARKEVEKQGYEIDDDEWFRKVGSGPKKPSVGKTNKYSIDLMKNDKDVKQKLNMQVYGMDNGKYELNMYVS